MINNVLDFDLCAYPARTPDRIFILEQILETVLRLPGRDGFAKLRDLALRRLPTLAAALHDIFYLECSI